MGMMQMALMCQQWWWWWWYRYNDRVDIKKVILPYSYSYSSRNFVVFPDTLHIQEILLFPWTVGWFGRFESWKLKKISVCWSEAKITFLLSWAGAKWEFYLYKLLKPSQQPTWDEWWWQWWCLHSDVWSNERTMMIFYFSWHFVVMMTTMIIIMMITKIEGEVILG